MRLEHEDRRARVVLRADALRTTVLCLLFSALVACTSPIRSVIAEVPKPPSNFKGLKFGMTVAEAKQATSMKNCSAFEKSYSCQISTELTMFTVNFEHSRLRSIIAEFYPSDFEELEKIFTEKYGKPRATESLIQNAFGAGYTQRELYWPGEGFTIFLDRFMSSGSGRSSYHLNKGAIYVFPDSPKSQVKEIDEKKKKEQMLD